MQTFCIWSAYSNYRKYIYSNGCMIFIYFIYLEFNVFYIAIIYIKFSINSTFLEVLEIACENQWYTFIYVSNQWMNCYIMKIQPALQQLNCPTTNITYLAKAIYFDKNHKLWPMWVKERACQAKLKQFWPPLPWRPLSPECPQI